MSDTIDQITAPPASASPIAPGTLSRSGVPFDPARHIPKQHPRSGGWMPRGGRKPKAGRAAAPSPSLPPSSSLVDSSPPPSGSPGEPSAPAAEPPPPAAAPSFDDIERAAGAPAPSEPLPGAAAPSGDAALPAEASAEIACRALYAVTGAVIGDHKAATAGAAEHKSLTNVATAYIRHRGWAMVGFIAIVGTLLAYILHDGRREPITERFKKLLLSLGKKKPAPTDIIEVQTTPGAAAPDAPADVPAQFQHGHSAVKI